MESFQEAADGCTGLAGGVRRGGLFENAPEVFVAEAVRDVVAVQDGGEQFEVLAAGGIEASRVAAVDSLGFREVGQFAMGGGGVSSVAERLQVSLIAGEGVALIVMKVAHSFGHRAPRPMARSILARAFPEDFELTGLIDDGFDPQDQAKLTPLSFNTASSASSPSCGV